MSNHVNSRIVDVLKLSVLCLYANFSHFYFGSFCLTIFVCLSVHWKSKKKKKLFDNTSMKMWILFDMSSELFSIIF